MTTSQLKIVFLILLGIGIVVPYYFLISYIMSNGFDVADIYNEIVLTKLSLFAWADVVISAVALLLFAVFTRLISAKQIAVVALLTVTAGVSAGLPLLFYYVIGSRELKQG